MRKQQFEPLDREVLTLEEVADFLRVSAEVLKKEIRDGDLPARQFGTEWRIFRRDFDQYLENKLPKRPQVEPLTVASEAIQFSLGAPFEFRWPRKKIDAANKKKTEHFQTVYEGFSAGKRVLVAFSDKAERGATVFVNGRPMVRFKTADNFGKSGLMLSIIKMADRKQLRPGDSIPPAYAGMRVESYRASINRPHASTNMAVVCRKDDYQAMAKHALIRAQQIEERKLRSGV